MAYTRGAVLVCFSAAVAIPYQTCLWTLPEGVQYDFSALRGQVFAFQFSSSKDYRYSLCGNMPGFVCGVGNQPSTSLLLNTPGGGVCTSSFGRAENTSAVTLASDITAGVTLSYFAGGPCLQIPGAQLYSIFNVACDPSKPKPVVTSFVDLPPCGISYNVAGAQGCGTRISNTVTSSAQGWIVFLGVASGLTVLFLGGMQYNRTVHGSTGMEAVPFISAWRALYSALIEPIVEKVSRRAARADDYTLAAGADDDIQVRA